MTTKVRTEFVVANLKSQLQRVKGEFHQTIIDRVGEEHFFQYIEFWKLFHAIFARGDLTPVHFKATKRGALNRAPL